MQREGDLLVGFVLHVEHVGELAEQRRARNGVERLPGHRQVGIAAFLCGVHPQREVGLQHVDVVHRGVIAALGVGSDVRERAFDVLRHLGVYLGPGRTRRVNLPPGALGGRQDDGRVAPYAGDPVVDVCPDEIGVPEAVAARLVRHFDRRRVLYHRVALVDTGVEVRPAYRRRAPVEQAVQYLQHVRVHQRTVRTAVPHGGPDAQFAPEELVRVILPEGVAQFEIDTRRRARDIAFVHPHVRRVELVGVDDIELAPRHRHRGGAYRCNI